ncbi:hypothetical protein CsSME_00043456 [Camellia sinensis var. sinensis]
MVAFLLTSLCVFFPLAIFIIKFLHKVWWTPIRVQYMMGLQGIKGPSYSFLHGSTKQIMNMRKESFATAMDLSHQYSQELCLTLMPGSSYMVKIIFNGVVLNLN